MTTTSELEEMVTALQASGRYRVLRRIEPRSVFAKAASGEEVLRGLFVDLETTGLDPVRDEVIELAMVPFTYGRDGRIFEVSEPFAAFRQPSRPISAEITALTGITDQMVAGKAIDPAAVAAFVEPAALVIAHNARFDRRFAERLSEAFVGKPWACSMTQVDWRAEGFEGTKLSYLAMHAGYFFDGHRAAIDCHAALELLAAPLPRSGQPALARLLERARRPSWRIWATGAPYDRKDALKARGYRWNGDDPAQPRAWCVDVHDDEAREAELAYLKTEIFGRADADPLIRRLTAFERFSERG